MHVYGEISQVICLCFSSHCAGNHTLISCNHTSISFRTPSSCFPVTLRTQEDTKLAVCLLSAVSQNMEEWVLVPFHGSIQATITSHQNDSNSFLTGLPALTHALHAFHLPLSFFPSFFPSSLFSPSLFFPGFLLFSLSPSNPLFFLSFCFKMYILLLFRYMRPTYLMIAVKITVGYISQEERACHTMQGHTGKQ